MFFCWRSKRIIEKRKQKVHNKLKSQFWFMVGQNTFSPIYLKFAVFRDVVRMNDTRWGDEVTRPDISHPNTITKLDKNWLEMFLLCAFILLFWIVRTSLGHWVKDNDRCRGLSDHRASGAQDWPITGQYPSSGPIRGQHRRAAPGTTDLMWPRVSGPVSVGRGYLPSCVWGRSWVYKYLRRVAGHYIDWEQAA